MDTEQPSGSDQSVENRLSAFFAGDKAPEAAPKAEAQPQEAAEATQEDTQSASDETPTDEQQDDTSAPDVIEVEDDSGQKHQVPAALKDAVLRRDKFTKEMQSVAVLRKQAEDRAHYVAAREQILGDVIQDVVALKNTESQLSQLENLDWTALHNADPGQAFSLARKVDALKEQKRQQEQALQEKTRKASEISQMHASNQWQAAVEGAKKRLGTVTPAEDAAMLRTVTEMGFSQDELMSRFADPRFLHIVNLAAKYQQLQGQKPGAVAAATKAPPIVKPGAVRQGAAAENKYRDARQALKKSGDLKDAARLFMLKG